MTTATQHTVAERAIDPDVLNALVGQAVGDFGAVLNAALVVVGDRLGLYRAMADAGSVTSAELAERTGTTERNVREWLSAQAATGFVTYDGDSDGIARFSLTPEQREAFTNEGSPAFLVGGFQVVTAAAKADEKVAAAFRAGGGLGWHEHHHDLFEGTERFFRPGYAASLVDQWLPALHNGAGTAVVEVLQRGGQIADVGCGHGASTVLMAKAFPNSTFSGFDYHDASIDAACAAAASNDVTPNTRFAVAPAATFPPAPSGGGYDLVCYFDCLHDMGDPVGALRHTREMLADDGVVMLVEPAAADALADNLNPVGRLFYAVSTLVCTPASQSQEIGLALGAQAGVGRLTAVANEAGFSRVQQVAGTPFNVVLELRR